MEDNEYMKPVFRLSESATKYFNFEDKRMQEQQQEKILTPFKLSPKKKPEIRFENLRIDNTPMKQETEPILTPIRLTSFGKEEEIIPERKKETMEIYKNYLKNKITDKQSFYSSDPEDDEVENIQKTMEIYKSPTISDWKHLSYLQKESSKLKRKLNETDYNWNWVFDENEKIRKGAYQPSSYTKLKECEFKFKDEGIENCDYNDLNNIFTSELEKQMTEQCLCFGDEEIYKRLLECKQKDLEDNNKYFIHGKKENDTFNGNEVLNNIIKKIDDKFDYTNPLILGEIEIEMITLSKQKSIGKGRSISNEFWQGLGKFEDKGTENKTIILSLDEKQAFLESIEQFYKKVSSSKYTQLMEKDGNKLFIDLPHIYKFHLKEDIPNILLINGDVMKYLSDFFQIRWNVGDSSYLDIIEKLKELYGNEINGWINLFDRYQLVLFDESKLTQEEKIKEKNKTVIRNIDESYLNIFGEYINNDKRPVTDEILDFKLKINNDVENKLLLDEFNFNEFRIKEIIIDYIEKDNRFSKYKDDLFQFYTNSYSLIYQKEMKDIMVKKLIKLNDGNQIKFGINGFCESFFKYIQISISNILRPIIYRIILDVQKEIKNCAEIIVGGREASNLSVKPNERVISTDIDTKLYINFYFPSGLEPEIQRKILKTVYYDSKEKFINKFYYEIMTNIMNNWNLNYHIWVYKFLYKLENTFEMKLFDIKFPRPINDTKSQKWLIKRYHIIEATATKPTDSNYIDLFVFDMIITNVSYPLSSSISLNSVPKNLTTYAMIDMPLDNKKNITDKIDKTMITNDLIFGFGRINSSEQSALNISKQQNDYRDIPTINGKSIPDCFKDLYFLNRIFEMRDKQRLIATSQRIAEKTEKDKRTLKSLQNTPCKVNNNNSSSFFDNMNCLMNQLKTLELKDKNRDIRYYNKIIQKCECDLPLFKDRIDLIYETNGKSSVLAVASKKLIRYIFSRRLINNFLNIYKQNENEFEFNKKYIEFLENITNNKIDIIEDRRKVVNKIFKYDCKTYISGSYNNYEEPGWQEYPFTDQELFRIDPEKYFLNMKAKERGLLKNVFLFTLDEWLNILNFDRIINDEKNGTVMDIESKFDYYLKIKEYILILVYGAPNFKSKLIDTEWIHLLTFEDIFFMLWRYWSMVLFDQTFVFPRNRYDRLKNITKNIFKILVLNDVIEKQDKNSSLEIVTNSDNFDEFFDNLIRIINNDIVLPTLYDSDGDIFNKLELAELEDDVEDAEETVEI